MSNLLLPSRRGFLTGLGACFAAPAIVRAASLMPVRAWDIGLREGPALVQPDWLTLDDYHTRVLQPMVNTLRSRIAEYIMNNTSEHGLLA
jgi:hypothetical protein